MQNLNRAIRYLWAAPTTALGITIAVTALLTGGTVYVRNGIIEVHGASAAFSLKYITGLGLKGGAAALTLGHVVIGRDRQALDRTRAHERVHVKQCESWGPFFVPAYLAASAIAWMRGGDAYFDNRFEREAFRVCL
jgi:hypothetical protein